MIARNLGYAEYMQIKKMPMFNLGAYKGGLIVEQRTVREHPLGSIAQRSVGYERFDENGYATRVGLKELLQNFCPVRKVIALSNE